MYLVLFLLEDSAVPEAVKRVQTKKKHSFKTIEKNLSNINVSEANRRCEVGGGGLL